ncbi:MAG: DNA cytosine methyltransferase [Microcoleaceae cyanobacterium]
MLQNSSNLDYTRPIAVDLFAGAGGMSLGFEQAGFNVLAAVEIDPIHCAVHQYNFPYSTIFCRDITTISADEIRDASNIGDRSIDVVFGGPPCQGFSLMGKRLLEDSRNQLVFHFMRLVAELKPKYFVLENVKGMAAAKHHQLIQELIDKFVYYGYYVQLPYQVLNAADYGVPQKRERLFLMGSKIGLPLPKYPEPISQNSFKSSNSLKTPTVWQAIQDLPEVENYSELIQQDWVEAEFKSASYYGEIMQGKRFLDDDYSYSRIYQNNLLTSSLRTQHNSVSIERFKQTLSGKTEPISRFHKLDPNGLCNTLRAGTPSSRGAHTSARPIHPFTPRCITVREAARLHSYPDWFRFHVTKWHGFRQVGNSVPPFLAASVAAEIIKLLEVNLKKPQEKIKLKNDELLTFNPIQAAKFYQINPDLRPTRKRQTKPSI